MNKEHHLPGHSTATYPSATAIIADDQQNRPLVGNVADFYSNPYVYVPDANFVPTAQGLPANFFQPAAYFQAGTPTLDFLWTPWSIEMIHGSELNSPLVEYHSQQFPTNSSVHNRLPPLQPGLGVPAEFPLQSFMTRSAGNLGVSAYGTRSQTSGRKGGRRPREIEDKDQFDLSQEDKEKRAKRRERNKQAAARCRKRRMDLMESLQKQVDDLRAKNTEKQLLINHLDRQLNEMRTLLKNHDCVHSKMLSQQLLQQQANEDQSLLYNGCNLIQQQVHLKMEPDSDRSIQSEMDSIFKDETLGSDRVSPINDSYPITTCSMITNNDPVISHAAFQASSAKRSKLDQVSLISSESNESPAFSRPNTLPLTTSHYCSTELANSLPSLNTPSAGLNIYTGNEFNLLSQQTFLTPMTLGPVPVTSNANTPPHHGDLRQL